MFDGYMQGVSRRDAGHAIDLRLHLGRPHVAVDLMLKQHPKVSHPPCNPFEDLAEQEFLQRFRLTKGCVLNLLENIRGQLPIAADARGCPIPQHLQLLITLRCMATGGHQLTISDCYQVSQTSISRCIRTVTPIIAQMAKDYVKMPTGMNAIRVMEGFLEIARMPGIVGAIDCTHIHILRPACENPELYRNRKAGLHNHCHPAQPGKQKAIKIVADIKNKAREDVFRSAAAIMEDAILKEIKPEDPEASVPKPGLLIRQANRLRQAMRPEDPKDLEFDISENFLPPNFLQRDIYVDEARHLLFAITQQLEVLKKARTCPLRPQTTGSKRVRDVLPYSCLDRYNAGVGGFAEENSSSFID
ncbi:hypothetical protein O3P69_009459 [Scylla paramamosain]|uniref:Nuclease HARBI1 n=1 Tax=Scylla paramamosain TaxID=85552 RepID=A0AAW0SXI6_SCYPA